MQIGGTPGLAVAVMTRDELVYQDNFGFRDLESSLPVNSQTLFPGASLTKAITATAFAMLVDEGKAAWDTPVSDLLPSFKSRDDTLQEFATVTDLLCHRHGMMGSDGYAVSSQNNILVPGDRVMRFLNSKPRRRPFRGQFKYNNSGYELAGKVIEHVSGVSYADYVKTHIFDPLHMESSLLSTPPSTKDNVAKAYNTLEDATPVRITAPEMGDDWWGAASGGIRSNIDDLLKLYKFFLNSFNGKMTPLGDFSQRQGPYLMSSRIPLERASRYEASYSMGLARVQLPARMGQIGLNPQWMPEGMPVVGKGVPSRLVLFHQGSLAGALAFVCLVPDTESIILVLSNALAMHDVPDFVGQLLLEELLDVPQPDRIDFIKAASTAVKTNLEWYPRVSKQLEEQRENGTSPRDLQTYVGTYWDEDHIFKIVVTLEAGRLYRALQGLESEKFQLHHYEHDTFTWLTTRNDISSRGRFVGDGPSYYKTEFTIGSDGKTTGLIWDHDGVPETFSKLESLGTKI